MDAKDLQFFKDMLNGMLDDTLRKSEATIEDMTESGEVYADPADRATAESDRAFTLRLRDRERKLVKKIQKAVDRIDDGDFGITSAGRYSDGLILQQKVFIIVCVTAAQACGNIVDR